ncbi:hypothetical protein BGW36DRAFT_293240 [Talaromyces proteolyticus]|uniref:Uncharacterized protein n=1 Tax=Talaromyces proteolyticus TaxID=1131652 RepID=A0AAD4PZL3_9EURO|nr:uncharacterized protein BGW36DRAFT_293240 [Talaromyces proteolyticus]KAH8699146.1 hypothetical protein BGW36DRAFT_293240 [Talaromyces proteolyticus]
MSGFRGMMKDGWHPKGKEGGKESWRGDFKGINQVAGWVGKGKDQNADQAEHVSRPLSSLQDPASFGPPPRRNTAGTTTVSSKQTAAPTSSPTPSRERRGQVAPLTTNQVQQYHAPPEEERPSPPPLPYRVDRTGLSTDHLPPPPGRNTDISAQPATAPSSRLGLPPRLPARDPASAPPPPYSETDSTVQINQGAVSRLGQAGVSVPALGIGRSGSEQSNTAQTNLNNQVNELQTRFGNMTTNKSHGPQNSPSQQSPNGVPTDGTTLAEKQDALRTARNVHSDPSSVSAADVRSSASTANNFRQRHNDQFEAGKEKLSAFNQKHRITERIQAYFEKPPAENGQQTDPPPPPPPHPSLSRQSSNIDVEALNKRKPPPPPPPAKKPGLQSNPVGSSSPSPPPLPLGTKPR